MLSHFYAYISKIRWLKRWSLKRNVVDENVMEHSWETAVNAHALAIIKNQLYGGRVDAHMVAATALYHDCAEIITGDMPSPIKYHSRDITRAYKAIERQAESELLNLLPPELKPHYEELLIEDCIQKDIHELVKAADLLSAYLKCLAEVTAGNTEFTMSLARVHERLKSLGLEEVDYFMSVFIPSCSLSLDELLTPSSD